MTWFNDLFGFEESEYLETKSKFKINKEKNVIMSTVNGKKYPCGKFCTPSLRELKEYALSIKLKKGDMVVKHVITKDIMNDHNNKKNSNSTFQVASQFNCLEFPSSVCTPEMGVTVYEYDLTQGPACSLAAAPATVYRNYFTNQTKYNQMDNSKEFHEYIKSLSGGNKCDKLDEYWGVKNGYTNSNSIQLDKLNKILTYNKIIPNKRGGYSNNHRENAISNIKVGLHSNVGVVLRSKNGYLKESPNINRVTQVFCSAISCSYANSSINITDWEPLSRLILEGAYEATLWIAAIEYSLGVGSGKVFLTMLGGGAFGNMPEWIAGAISRSISKIKKIGIKLEVNIVHYQKIDENMKTMIMND